MLKLTARNISSEIIQVAYFHTVFVCGEIAIWTYFTSLLLKAADYSIEVVILKLTASYVGVMIGFALAGIGFSRLGYTWNYRISNIILALSCLLALIFLPQILNVYILIGLLRGVAGGFFWLPHHVFNLKDVGGDARKVMYSKLLASSDLIAILLPPLAGALINLQGYDWLFLLGFLFYFAAIFMRWTNVPIKQEVFKLAELKKITKRYGFKAWAVITFTEEVFLNMRNISTVILPFLLITSEFEVGIFLGIIGFFSAFIKLWQGYRSDKKLFFYGTLGAWIVVLSNFILVVFWNLPGLFLRTIISRLGFAFYDQAKVELKYRGREMLNGDFRQQYSLEVQELAEFLMFLARISSVLITFAGIYWLKIDAMQMLLVIFVLSAFREPIGLWLDTWFLRQLKRKHKL